MNLKTITEDTKALVAVRLAVFVISSIVALTTILVTCTEDRLNKIESGLNRNIDKVEKRVFRVEALLMEERSNSETDGSSNQNHEANEKDNNQSP